MLDVDSLLTVQRGQYGHHRRIAMRYLLDLMIYQHGQTLRHVGNHHLVIEGLEEDRPPQEVQDWTPTSHLTTNLKITIEDHPVKATTAAVVVAAKTHTATPTLHRHDRRETRTRYLLATIVTPICLAHEEHPGAIHIATGPEVTAGTSREGTGVAVRIGSEGSGYKIASATCIGDERNAPSHTS